MSKALQQKIKALREAAGLRLEGLAKETGISKSYLWEIENRPNAPSPSAEKLALIAAVFNVTVDYLLEEDAAEPGDEVRDEAFFRNYKGLAKADKEQLQRILDTFRKD